MGEQGKEGVQRARQRKGGDRQDGIESWRSSHGIVQSLACLPAGPLPATGSRHSGHFCPDTKEEEAFSPALPSARLLWAHQAPGIENPIPGPSAFQAAGAEPCSSQGAKKKTQRRHDEGGFTLCSSVASLPGHRAPRPPFQLSQKKDTPRTLFMGFCFSGELSGRGAAGRCPFLSWPAFQPCPAGRGSSVGQLKSQLKSSSPHSLPLSISP